MSGGSLTDCGCDITLRLRVHLSIFLSRQHLAIYIYLKFLVEVDAQSFAGFFAPFPCRVSLFHTDGLTMVPDPDSLLLSLSLEKKKKFCCIFI